MAQSDGSDRWVVLQEETCRAAAQPAGGSIRSLRNEERLAEQLGGGTFGGGRECRPLDGVGLEAAVKHVVPQRHHAILPPRHKTLSQRHTADCRRLGALNNNIIIIVIIFVFSRLLSHQKVELSKKKNHRYVFKSSFGRHRQRR